MKFLPNRHLHHFHWLRRQESGAEAAVGVFPRGAGGCRALRADGAASAGTFSASVQNESNTWIDPMKGPVRVSRSVTFTCEGATGCEGLVWSCRWLLPHRANQSTFPREVLARVRGPKRFCRRYCECPYHVCCALCLTFRWRFSELFTRCFTAGPGILYAVVFCSTLVKFHFLCKSPGVYPANCLLLAVVSFPRVKLGILWSEIVECCFVFSPI